MLESVTIEIPLPPAELLPGACPDDIRKHRATVNYRTRVCALVVAGLGTLRPRWTGARVSSTFFFPDGAPRDPVNLARSLEPAFDAMGDAGLVADSHVMIRLPPVQQNTTERPCVRLTVESLGNGEEEGE